MKPDRYQVITIPVDPLGSFADAADSLKNGLNHLHDRGYQLSDILNRPEWRVGENTSGWIGDWVVLVERLLAGSFAKAQKSASVQE